MKEPREAFPIRAPAKVGPRVDRSHAGAFEPGGGTEEPAEHGSDRLLLNRQRRLAFAAPDFLVGIRQQRIDDLAKARAGIEAIFVGELFRADFHVRHLSPRSNYTPGNARMIQPAWRTGDRRHAD